MINAGLLPERGLHDNVIDTKDRLAGLLLRYGQGPSAISLLTIYQISISDSDVRITLGRKPIRLPTPSMTLPAPSSSREKATPPSGATGHRAGCFP